MHGYRLGVATRVIGATIRPHDSRRWQQTPHLSISLAYLRDMLEYLHDQAIHFYRLSSQLAPYLTHPALPQFHHQIDECTLELAAIGDLARAYAIRLTMHPAFYLQLGSADDHAAARALHEVQMADCLLDSMGLGEDAVLVVHAGFAHGNHQAALDTVARRIEQMPVSVRRRLAIEHDDRTFDLHDVLWLHKHSGVRVVFDALHHRCLDRQRIPVGEALGLALTTWPADQRPKIHMSSTRTELRTLRRNGQSHLLAPLPNQHSDFINPFELIDLIAMAQAAHLRPFDIMLEAKACDLALLRLRSQVGQFAPELAALVV